MAAGLDPGSKFEEAKGPDSPMLDEEKYATLLETKRAG
jgi:hypothetical protein